MCSNVRSDTHGCSDAERLSCKEPAHDHQCSSRSPVHQPGPARMHSRSRAPKQDSTPTAAPACTCIHFWSRCQGVRPDSGVLASAQSLQISAPLTHPALMFAMLAAAQQAAPAEPVQQHRQRQRHRTSESYLTRHVPALVGLCKPELGCITSSFSMHAVISSLDRSIHIGIIAAELRCTSLCKLVLQNEIKTVNRRCRLHSETSCAPDFSQSKLSVHLHARVSGRIQVQKAQPLQAHGEKQSQSLGCLMSGRIHKIKSTQRRRHISLYPTTRLWIWPSAHHSEVLSNGEAELWPRKKPHVFGCNQERNGIRYPWTCNHHASTCHTGL